MRALSLQVNESYKSVHSKTYPPVTVRNPNVIIPNETCAISFQFAGSLGLSETFLQFT